MRTTVLLLLATLFVPIGCSVDAPAPQSPAGESKSTKVSPTQTPIQLTKPESPTETPTSEPTVTVGSTRGEESAAQSDRPTLQVFGTRQSGTSVTPSELTDEMTGYWLMPFTHTDPVYVDAARSAFALAEDGDFCNAARKFRSIYIDARDQDGSRLPAASYDAGVLYLISVETGSLCVSKNLTGVDYAVSALEYTWQHRSHSGFDPEINFLLGWAKSETHRSYSQRDRKSAIPYLCEAANDENLREQALGLVKDIGGSCRRQ